MSLVAKAPSTLSSSASESPVKKSYGSQNPWSGNPLSTGDVYSARYSGWDDDKAWSSQEWKAGKSMDDRTGQPVVCPQRGAMPQQFIIGDDEAELELSLGSRSFLDRVNGQVRKRQKQSSEDATKDSDKHPTYPNFLLQQHGEQIEKLPLSEGNRVWHSCQA